VGRREVGHCKEFAELVAGRSEFRVQVGAFAEPLPQRHASPSVGELEQQLLAPAHQGRNQQVREVQVVQRLGSESDRCEQILDGQRLLEMQAIDTRYGHTFLEEARDDQRSQFASATDEDEDIAGT
jgi:hypothetical protein